MEKTKKSIVLRIANYIFIISSIIFIGNIMFVTPEADNVFRSNLMIAEILAAMPIGQLGLLIGISGVCMICIIVAILKSNGEKVITKGIIKYLVMLLVSIVILCVSIIYVYHHCMLKEVVTKQARVCIDDIKGNIINPTQLNINKVVSSADSKRKYRYITIDYSTNKERKIVIYKLENTKSKILKQYETNNIEYASSMRGLGAYCDELDIDVQKIK